MSPIATADAITASPRGASGDAFVLAVDLDGVVADFYPALRRAFAAHRQAPLETLPEQFGMDLAEWDAQPGEYERVHQHAVTSQQLFGRLDPIPDAPQALQRLSDLGLRIRIVTHRLYLPGTHHAAITQTVDWLEQHEVPYWDLCFLKDKTAVTADLYLDDGPHNIAALQAAGRDLIAFTAPPNVHLQMDTGHRADTWTDAEALVRQRHSAWTRRQTPVPAVPAQGRP